MKIILIKSYFYILHIYITILCKCESKVWIKRHKKNIKQMPIKLVYITQKIDKKRRIDTSNQSILISKRSDTKC